MKKLAILGLFMSITGAFAADSEECMPEKGIETDASATKSTEQAKADDSEKDNFLAPKK